jgi:GIY-YIG catalytic domain/NUMOD3 motif
VRFGVIYFLLDPQTREIRYVGQTVQSPAKRLTGHLNDARKGKNRHVCHWIRNLLPDKPLMQVVETLPEDKLDEAEQYWIAFLRSMDAALCNLADGGGGTRGFRHTEETLRKQVAAAQRRRESEQWLTNLRNAIRNRKGGNNRLGTHHSLETRAKMSAAQVGRQVSAETRAKMSAAAKARALTAEGRANLRAAGRASHASGRKAASGDLVLF